MGYLFLLIALLAGATKGYCGKKTGNLTSDIKDAVSVNVLRMLFCIPIGLILILIQDQTGGMVLDAKSFLITAASGICTSVFVITWLLSVKKNAYMMLEISLMLGILVPITASYFLYGESVSLNEIIGILFLIAATYMMVSYSNSQKQKLTGSTVILLIVCGVSYGLTDFTQKAFVKTSVQAPASVFNFYTYVVAFSVLLVMLFCFGERNVNSAKQSVKRVFTTAAGYVFVMAVCLFANSYFKTLSAKYLDAVQLYPLSQGASLILSSLMASVFFKEKMTLKCICGIILAFIGLIFINVFSF